MLALHTLNLYSSQEESPKYIILSSCHSDINYSFLLCSFLQSVMYHSLNPMFCLYINQNWVVILLCAFIQAKFYKSLYSRGKIKKERICFSGLLYFCYTKRYLLWSRCKRVGVGLNAYIPSANLSANFIIIIRSVDLFRSFKIWVLLNFLVNFKWNKWTKKYFTNKVSVSLCISH